MFLLRGVIDDGIHAITSHPDHVKSLFTAKPEQAPSLTGESPLRPIVGPNSVLTAIGPRHMRQRKLLLPPFHGEAVQRYVEMIGEAADREIDRWPIGDPVRARPADAGDHPRRDHGRHLRRRGTPAKGRPSTACDARSARVVDLSTRPEAQVFELLNLGSDEPVGPTRAFLSYPRPPRLRGHRRAARGAGADERTDILSLLLEAETEDGERLTDKELRDELLTLVLAGHETTANSLAWTFERLLRHPAAYERLRDVARSGSDPDDYLEATIHEGMRSRPVIPIIGRRVTVPWQLGEYRMPADSAV